MAEFHLSWQHHTHASSFVPCLRKLFCTDTAAFSLCMAPLTHAGLTAASCFPLQDWARQHEQAAAALRAELRRAEDDRARQAAEAAAARERAEAAAAAAQAELADASSARQDAEEHAAAARAESARCACMCLARCKQLQMRALVLGHRAASALQQSGTYKAGMLMSVRYFGAGVLVWGHLA